MFSLIVISPLLLLGMDMEEETLEALQCTVSGVGHCGNVTGFICAPIVLICFCMSGDILRNNVITMEEDMRIRMLSMVGLLLGAISLGGCEIAGAWISQSVEQAKAAKDLEAEVLKAGLCAMSVGSKNRKFPEDAAVIDGLCFGPKPQPQPPTLDADTIEVLRLLLELRPSTPE